MGQALVFGLLGVFGLFAVLLYFSLRTQFSHPLFELGGFFRRQAHGRSHGFGVGLAEALRLSAGNDLLDLGVAHLVDADVAEVLGREGCAERKGQYGQKTGETHGLEHLAQRYVFSSWPKGWLMGQALPRFSRPQNFEIRL